MIDDASLQAWITSQPAHETLRKAMYAVLLAIATRDELRQQLIFKGGAYLALAYNTGRHTKDLDFSLEEAFTEGKDQQLREELDRALRVVSSQLSYGLRLRIQSVRIQPGPGATFVGLKMTVGYAKVQNARALERLKAGRSSDVLKLDISFNEPTPNVRLLRLSDSSEVRAYDLIDTLAEKLRAMLQQPVRRRNRRQDVYDLHWLLSTQSLSPDAKAGVLASLRLKCIGRLDGIDRDGLASLQVREASARDYPQLEDEITGALPDFDHAYGLVQEFYESLPW